jgi:predicted Zn-dependent peptidase
MEGQRTATALILVEAGSKYEKREENGLSHFLEHMCFKGTERRPGPQIVAQELDALGAEYNAFTGHEYTGYFAKVAREHLPAALDIVADIFTAPRFLPEDIEREKGVIIGEIDMRADMLPSRASELFMELLYGDQPVGRPIPGLRERIKEFSREDFLAYRSKHYVPGATLVVVAGDFNRAAVRRQIHRLFAGIKRGAKESKEPVNTTLPSARVRYQEKGSDQTHLMLGVPGIPIQHADVPAATLLAAVLGGGMGSRLFRRIRGDLGLGYYVHASHDAFTDHGIFTIAAGVASSRCEEAISAIRDELKHLRDAAVPAEELSRVKSMLRGKFVLGLESSHDVAEYFGIQTILKRSFETPEENIRRLERVGSDDLRRLARKLFAPERLRLAAVGPRTDVLRLEEALTAPIP